LVFYMARKYAAEIAAALVAAGRQADEPAAIIANAARANQCVIVTDLAGLGSAAEKAPGLSIIVVGENVRLRAELDWLGKKALALNPL
jgi:siroheme synthase